LAVRDPKRSARFYRKLFGCTVTYTDAERIELTTPGDNDSSPLIRRCPLKVSLPGLRTLAFGSVIQDISIPL
jgi:hypothetical protein